MFCQYLNTVYHRFIIGVISLMNQQSSNILVLKLEGVSVNEYNLYKGEK